MGEIRWIKKAAKDFDRALCMTNAVEALQLIGNWVGKPIEEDEVARFDKNTGEPVKTGKFKPCEGWDGVLWLDSFSNSPSVPEESPLYNSLLQTVKEGETVSMGSYIVQHIPSCDSGGFGSMADQGGTTPAHFRIIKPRRI